MVRFCLSLSIPFAVFFHLPNVQSLNLCAFFSKGSFSICSYRLSESEGRGLFRIFLYHHIEPEPSVVYILCPEQCTATNLKCLQLQNRNKSSVELFHIQALKNPTAESLKKIAHNKTTDKNHMGKPTTMTQSREITNCTIMHKTSQVYYHVHSLEFSSKYISYFHSLNMK